MKKQVLKLKYYFLKSWDGRTVNSILNYLDPEDEAYVDDFGFETAGEYFKKAEYFLNWGNFRLALICCAVGGKFEHGVEDRIKYLQLMGEIYQSLEMYKWAARYFELTIITGNLLPGGQKLLVSSDFLNNLVFLFYQSGRPQKAKLLQDNPEKYLQNCRLPL